MLPAPIDSTYPSGTPSRRARDFRRRLAWLSVLATVVATLVGTGAAPAGAVQASGDEVPSWSTGWSWTYDTVFNYTADGTNATINERVTYTVAGVENFQGQPAYRLNLTGSITGGSGAVAVDGVGNATLSNFGGSVTGHRYMRRSDFALLQESQVQNLTAKAQVSIISQNITANINLTMDPQRGWRLLQFPTEAGNSWTNDVDVDYDGGFSYDAGSLGGTGASDFEGVLEFDGLTTVANEALTVPAGSNISTRRAVAQSADGNTKSTMWYSPTHRNAARLLLQIPLDGGSLTLDQKLFSASTPAPATTLTSTVTPSLTCAGGDIVVAGRLSSGAAGVPVTVALDRSPVSAGAAATTTTTTTTGGNYTATLQAPSDSDGYQRTGVRGSWGIVTTAGGASSTSTVVVTPQNCSAITYTGDAAAPQGTTATVSATLVDKTGASAAGRTITFALSGGATATATTNAAGVAETTIAVAGPARAATITASYAGSAGVEAASTTADFAVGKIATATVVAAEPPVATVGDPIRFTADVSPTHGGTPSGTVQFQVNGANFGGAVALVDGSATSAALSTLPIGYHQVVAVYSGSADHQGSTSEQTQFRVRQPLLATTTTSTVSPASSVYGQQVTLTADVATASGTPTGDVVFTIGGAEVARAGVTPDGEASTTVSDLPVGNHQVVAAYAGDDVYAASAASPKSLVVAKAQVTISLSSADSSTVSGEAVSLTAVAAVQAPGGGTPAGDVQLVVDGADVGGPVALDNGVAAFPALTGLGAGTHTIEARYAGDARYAAAADSVEQLVEQADTTVAVQANPSPSVQDENVQLSATVSAVAPGSGSPTGTVSFYAGTELLGTIPLAASPAGSTATLDLDDLAPGVHEITARYAGDADYRESTSSPVSHTVIAGVAVVATSTTLTSSANPSTYGTPVTFRATVTADGEVPSGTVQFSVDGQDVGAPVPVDDEGVATSPAVDTAEPGDHTVIASFVGAPGFSGSGDIIVQTVDVGSVDIDLSSSAASTGVGQGVSFSVAVTSQHGETPTGFVQFAIDGHPLGSAVALVDGTADSPTAAGLVPGTHTVTALYSGDARYGSATADLTHDVVQVATTTGLSLSTTSPTFGDAVQATAVVTAANADQGAPTGTVTFFSGSTAVGTVTLAPATGPDSDRSAVATLTLSSLTAGSHPLKAVYAGNDTFQGSSSAGASVAVAKRTTTLTADPAVVKLIPIGLPLGQLRATLSGVDGVPVAGVPVEFRAGAKLLCTATTNQSGIAVCDAQSQILALTLALGYTATFNGDANHLSSTARGALIK